MDQVRPLPIQWPCDHATVDWSTYPLQTPSGGGRAPTPYRSKTPAKARRKKGLTFRGPLQKGWARREECLCPPLRDQCFAASLAAALLSTIRPSTATPSLLLIKNGLTSIEAIRLPASAIRLERPTSAFTAEASCSGG